MLSFMETHLMDTEMTNPTETGTFMAPGNRE